MSNFNLPDHLESILGRISRGWGNDAANYGISVALFPDRPEVGLSTLTTLGLSKHCLEFPSGKPIHQELMVAVTSDSDIERIAGVLMSFAEAIADYGKALLRGQIVGPGEEIAGSRLRFLFVTNPISMPESLLQYDDDSLVLCYLVPVFDEEAARIKKDGWSWFEDQLEQQDVDIWNLRRTAIRL